MTVKPLPDGSGWEVDVRPEGKHGRRIRKKFFKSEGYRKIDATVHEGNIINSARRGEDYRGRKRDGRLLSELVECWFEYYGHTLKSGAQRKSLLINTITLLGDKKAREFTAADFSLYRSDRLEKGISPNTVNRELAYLISLFNELERLKLWSLGNPLVGVKKVKVPQSKMTFLTEVQIKKLLSKLESTESDCVDIVAKICLATGARWSEAAGLTVQQIHNRKITFTRTKNSKNRTVPVAENIDTLIQDYIEFRGIHSGKIFPDCYSCFKRAVDEIDLQLPKGQKSHVLRHTFASHFIMNGGNLKTLQEILGHKDIKTTMIYAHLTPEHLNAAVILNPLAKLSIDRKSSEI